MAHRGDSKLGNDIAATAASGRRVIWVFLALVAGLGAACARNSGEPPPTDGSMAHSDGAETEDADPGSQDGGVACVYHDECDDGRACNGSERCEDARCVPGAPIDCSDGVACTRDSCVDPDGECSNEPDDSLCPDTERCHPTEGCVSETSCLCNGDSCDGECIANSSFEDTHDDGTCERPEKWNFADESTGFTSNGHVCVTTSAASDGSRSVGVSWTGNSYENEADLWQEVSLNGVSAIELDLLGPSGGNPQRAKHLILIDGTVVADCGYVESGEQKTCTVDVSIYAGTHELRHRWKQRSGDNLGNSKIDHMRAVIP